MDEWGRGLLPSNWLMGMYHWVSCIFSTGLTVMGLYFLNYYLKGLHIFGIFRGRKILVRKDLKVRKNTSTESDEGEVFNWPQNRL